MFLGVDINEHASGNESSTSSGVAIKQAKLLISTTEGDFSFSNFYTNTSALISEEGSSEARQFYTLFGSSGSNQLTDADVLNALEHYFESHRFSLTLAFLEEGVRAVRGRTRPVESDDRSRIVVDAQPPGALPDGGH